MKKQALIRRLSAVFLAVCVFLSFLRPAAAAEPEETSLPETLPAESTAATEAPTLPETQPPTEPTEPAPGFSAPYNLYFGLLHAHSDISDGSIRIADAFTQAKEAGLDFFAVTDHSDTFDNAGSGSIDSGGAAISTQWAAGKAAAAAVTDETFLGLFGYEISWPEIRQLGHLTTFRTPGWISRDQAGFRDDADALERYYQALATIPDSVSQFCHPGFLFGTFENFGRWQPEYDDAIHLLETLGEGSVDSYIRALDQYWHVAPTGSQSCRTGLLQRDSGVRTAVLAESLSEEHFFEAIREHRVYATEDPDLHLCYALDGAVMGSVLSAADSPEISLSLYDPTDTGGFTLEVIAEGGVIVASQSVEENDIQLTVPGGLRWYFLKIIQSDGDTAVTAPVWVEGFENMGIFSFTADAELPVQGQAVDFHVELYNEEPVNLLLDALELYADGTLVHTADSPGAVASGETAAFRIPYAHPEAGTAELRVLIRGSVLGQPRQYEASLSLRFRSAEQVTGLLIDGSHGNLEPDSLSRVTALAREAGMDVTVFTGPMPRGGELLLIPALRSDPGEGFPEDLVTFLQSGGSVILWGQPEDNAPGNRLLEAAGSSLRFRNDTLPEGSTAVFSGASPWCGALREGQYFRHPEGCSLDPGSGSWLVKDASETHVLLAWEETPWGGSIFAAGSAFLLDAQIPQPQSIWELPRANQTIFQSILGNAQPLPEQTAIRDLRTAEEGEVFRIRGYVTAGTSNPHTSFPGTIYLQDDTGGIAVTGFTAPDIQIGTPVEVIGCLGSETSNPVLEYTAHRLPGDSFYRHVPRIMTCRAATDYSLHGGELVQVQGTVTGLTLTADLKGISRLTLKDIRGDAAVVEIEECIGSGATGRNDLAKEIKAGRTVRCMGLLHINSAGETVIRVRNCDEVVYIPPTEDPTNPKTGEPFCSILQRFLHRLR